MTNLDPNLPDHRYDEPYDDVIIDGRLVEPQTIEEWLAEAKAVQAAREAHG